MKSPFLTVAYTAILLTTGLSSQERAWASDEVHPVVKWRGVLEDPRVLKAKPGSGIISDQGSLKQLWTAWSMGPVPAIDFSRYVVVVAADYGGHLDCQLTRDDMGRAKLTAHSQTKSVECSFVVMVVSRANLISIDGHELADGKELDHDAAAEIRLKRSDSPNTGNTGNLPLSTRVLSTSEAAHEVGTGKTVIVEFEVKSVLPLPPDGKHVRLLSEDKIKDKNTFVVHLTEAAIGTNNQKELEKLFAGKRIRVSGKVEEIVLSSGPEMRPGIRIEKLEQVEVIKDE